MSKETPKIKWKATMSCLADSDFEVRDSFAIRYSDFHESRHG